MKIVQRGDKGKLTFQDLKPGELYRIASTDIYMKLNMEDKYPGLNSI